MFVGVTDSSWYRFLRDRPDLTEVNFWRPSGRGFQSLALGEPFVFKSHAPHNQIVGGAYFNGSVSMTVSDAWRVFGHGNGVASLTEMRSLIGKYRKQALDPAEDPVIGCVMLRDTLFFEDALTIDPPLDWKGNIVSGKSYDAADPLAASLLEALMSGTLERYSEVPRLVPGPVLGSQRLTTSRLGQKPFQALVLDAYHGRCAVTGEKIRPVLQAAHILPVARGGENRLDNGLLLRSDVHTLFDSGYLGLDSQHRLRVSPRLREQYENGVDFYRREGVTIDLPDRKVDRPNHEFIEWHADEVFLAS